MRFRSRFLEGGGLFSFYFRPPRDPHSLTVSSSVRNTAQPHNNNSDEVSGPTAVARYLLRAGEKAAASPAAASTSASAPVPPSTAARRLAASADPLLATRVDGWIDFAAGGALAPGPGFPAAAASLDAYLAPRSFLVGRGLTAADVAVWGALASSPVFPKLTRPAAAGGSSPLPHLARWFDLLSSQPDCAAALDLLDPRRRQRAADAAAVATGGRAKADGGSFDVALPGDPAYGSVVVRFPPEPSGFLHIGHAKAALLNQAVAQRYGGALRVRFDDTNPSKEKDEYVDNILKDLRALGVLGKAGKAGGEAGGETGAAGGGGGNSGGVGGDGGGAGDGRDNENDNDNEGEEVAADEREITYASDYFPQLAECAERLIDIGVLYADDTPVDQMREERMAGTPSRRRDRPPGDTRALFDAMRRGEAPGVVLRLKMDMASANTAMRDPVAYRCNAEVPHWRTGTTYKVRRGRRRGGARVFFLFPFPGERAGSARARAAKQNQKK